MLTDLSPQWLPRDGLYREESFITVTRGVRVLVRIRVSVDWSELG